MKILFGEWKLQDKVEVLIGLFLNDSFELFFTKTFLKKVARTSRALGLDFLRCCWNTLQDALQLKDSKKLARGLPTEVNILYDHNTPVVWYSTKKLL